MSTTLNKNIIEINKSKSIIAVDNNGNIKAPKMIIGYKSKTGHMLRTEFIEIADDIRIFECYRIDKLIKMIKASDFCHYTENIVFSNFYKDLDIDKGYIYVYPYDADGCYVCKPEGVNVVKRIDLSNLESDIERYLNNEKINYKDIIYFKLVAHIAKCVALGRVWSSSVYRNKYYLLTFKLSHYFNKVEMDDDYKVYPPVCLDDHKYYYCETQYIRDGDIDIKRTVTVKYDIVRNDGKYYVLTPVLTTYEEPVIDRNKKELEENDEFIEVDEVF